MTQVRRLRVRHRAAALLGLLLSVAFLVSVASAAPDTDKRNSYIIVMAADPVVAYDGGAAGIPATQPRQGAKINPESAAVRQYKRYLQRQHDASLKAADVAPAAKTNDYSVSLNGYSAILTDDQAKAIRSQSGVTRVMRDELQRPTTDASPRFLGLNRRGGAWLRGVDGRGVVVGVIDTGIWPEHPSFSDERRYGPYTAPPEKAGLPCEFGNSAHNPNDAAFTCNNKLIGARQMLATYRALIGAEDFEYDSARDDNGHGTHTASTAAGNRGVKATLLGIKRGRVSGIAPRAHVIAYKGLGDLGGFTSDLAASIDQAVEDGVDVINYSIGGGASLSGADDIAFLFAADAGVFVAASAGNSGPRAASIGGPASVPWLTTVGASTQERFFPGMVLLGNGARYTGASVTAGTGMAPLVDAADAALPAVPAARKDLCTLNSLDPAKVAGAIVLCRRGLVARVEKSNEVKRAGGVGMVMYENSDAGNLFSDTHFLPSVHVDNTPGLAIKAYAATANPTARIVALKPHGDDDDDEHDDEDDRRSDQALMAKGIWPWAPSMTDFSSRGPNPVAPSIIKPDVTAPGIQILAGNSPTPSFGVSGELFQAIAGTSMSSPHVAGLFALLKQARPDWSAAAAKSALMTTADTDVLDNDRTSQATPFGMGAGHVDLGSPTRSGSAFNPGLVYDAGFLEYLGFLCDADPGVFANPTRTCGNLAGAGIPTRAIDLNLASIGVSQVAGAETVERTVTSVASTTRTYTVDVDAPEGFEVSVQPSTLTIAPGESKSYEVTFTNVSAPLNTWQFGSLEWSDSRGAYDVQSPIAVRATKFAAPLELDLQGVSGSASFPVKFGYTGAYEAKGHGLTPATLTNANVKQDPNQDFDPSDVAAGGANAHVFSLSDVGVFRIAIPPEATEADADLDVFVANPSGTIVASSTLGGTNELVTIQSPANGNWTVYVHGWQAPGGDSDYTMYSWAVPNTTGGSLSVTSAPTSATLATSGTVAFDWSGATAGQWFLGAVSHNEGSTVLGRTLVEIDNR